MGGRIVLIVGSLSYFLALQKVKTLADLTDLVQLLKNLSLLGWTGVLAQALPLGLLNFHKVIHDGCPLEVILQNLGSGEVLPPRVDVGRFLVKKLDVSAAHMFFPLNFQTN
jgi:hypothetical protein